MPRLGQLVTLAVQHDGVVYTAHLKWIRPHSGSAHWHLAGEDCTPPITNHETLHGVYQLAIEKIESMS